MTTKKERYAKFLISRCLSMNDKEPLVIEYLKEQKEFVDIIKKEAKKLGITQIYEIENDEEKTKDILINSNLEQIKNNSYFNRKVIKDVYDKGGAYLSLNSYSKSLLDDVPKEKIKLMEKVKMDTQEDAINARITYKFPWCIAAVATKKWADKLKLRNEDELWDIIFELTLMNNKDPYEAWNKKISANNETVSLLNKLKLIKLNYKNNLGTNLEVGLLDNAIWYGASTKSFDGKKDLLVNIPTEEVFTSPNRNKINGVVYSSRPLVYKGVTIDRFSLVFKDGKVIEAHANNNEEKLLEILEEYENMRYLGECALVDYNSSISKTKMIFNTTLIDENASCHLALGKGFPDCLLNGNNLSDDQLLENGVNVSKNHVDFMIGTKDLSIIGTDVYGNNVPIFIDGDFALDEINKFLKERTDK